MISKLKRRFIGSEEKKRLVSNIFFLGGLQGANYILPLLTIPYLVRVLGPDYFGLLAFATATVAYFIIITDYGFNLSATRQVSIFREDLVKVNQIYSAVLIIKLGLMVFSLMLMSLMVFSFEKFSQNWEVYFITFGMVLGQAIFPVWLFQGMERMKYITYLNIVSKVFFTVCIFIFVHDESDYWVVPLLNSLGFIVVGIWSLILVRYRFHVRFSMQPVRVLKEQLYEGMHVFFSSIAISLYTISIIFILGLFSNNVIVGYFSVAEKIIQAVKGINAPIAQAIYPLMSKKTHFNKQAGLAFIRRVTALVGSVMFILSLMLFVFAESIVILVLGDQYQESILLLRIMAFLPFIIALSNIFGIQTMLNLGYKQDFAKILTVAAVIGVGLSFSLVPSYEGVGAALTLLFTEIFVTIAMYAFLRSKGIKVL